MRMKNQKSVRQTRHVVHVEEMKNAYSILVGIPERKRHYMGDQYVDERIILKWIKSQCQ
jgi:hypothetical protein